jgi:hypothetical protein
MTTSKRILLAKWLNHLQYSPHVKNSRLINTPVALFFGNRIVCNSGFGNFLFFGKSATPVFEGLTPSHPITGGFGTKNNSIRIALVIFYIGQLFIAIIISHHIKFFTVSTFISAMVHGGSYGASRINSMSGFNYCFHYPGTYYRTL